MNATADAIVADYARTRTAFAKWGYTTDQELMNRMKAAVAILWGGLEFDLDEAADNYLMEKAGY
jgi:hypothetical protein